MKIWRHNQLNLRCCLAVLAVGIYIDLDTVSQVILKTILYTYIYHAYTSRRTGNRAHKTHVFFKKWWFYHSAVLIWWLEILEKLGVRFLAFQRHRCNACTVISWQSAFLWMHLHCQALAYIIKRSLLALKLLGIDFFIRFHIEHVT